MCVHARPHGLMCEVYSIGGDNTFLLRGHLNCTNTTALAGEHHRLNHRPHIAEGHLLTSHLRVDVEVRSTGLLILNRLQPKNRSEGNKKRLSQTNPVSTVTRQNHNKRTKKIS